MMAGRESELGAMASELCRKFPNEAARTLARRLVKESGGAITLEHARSIIRYRFGTLKKNRRKYAIAKREPRAAGQRKWLPPSQAKPFVPVKIEGRNIGIVSDIHVPYHSELATYAAFNYLKEKKCDTILINGDAMDFYSNSRFEKKPSKRNLLGELNAGRHFFRELRTEFKKQRIYWKFGNHEHRWQSWLYEHAPEIAETPEMDLATWMHCEELGIETIDQLDLMEVGKLPVLHGHELGKGIAAPVNPARGAYLKTKHTILVSHHHQTSGHCEPDLYHSECFVWSIGCLCDLRPDYHRYGKTNWGFARVMVEKDGGFQVENLRINSKGHVRAS
jgi:predicted phosphodiesterase